MLGDPGRAGRGGHARPASASGLPTRPDRPPTAAPPRPRRGVPPRQGRSTRAESGRSLRAAPPPVRPRASLPRMRIPSRVAGSRHGDRLSGRGLPAGRLRMAARRRPHRHHGRPAGSEAPGEPPEARGTRAGLAGGGDRPLSPREPRDTVTAPARPPPRRAPARVRSGRLSATPAPAVADPACLAERARGSLQGTNPDHS